MSFYRISLLLSAVPLVALTVCSVTSSAGTISPIHSKLVVLPTDSAPPHPGFRRPPTDEEEEGGTAVVYEPLPPAKPVVLRRTHSAVLSPSLKDAGIGGILYATWSESTMGSAEHRVTISKDGGTTWSRSRAMSYDILLRVGTIVPGASAPALPADLMSEAASTLFIVQFETVGLQAWRDRLTALGAQVLSFLPGNAHVVRMSAPVAAAVSRQSFVRWVGPYHPGYRVEPEILGELRSETSRDGLPRRYILQTFTPGPAEKDLLSQEVRLLGGKVVRQIPDGYLLEADLTLGQLARLAHSDHVSWIERWTPAGTDMDIVRQQSGANYIEGFGRYDGTGVRGEVLDDGIMLAPRHQDHDNLILHGPFPSLNDHGTCTYGILFGNGDRDGDGESKATGMLPAAVGYFSDFDYLTNRYQHTAELVSPPINASFQSNSWGSDLTRSYTSASFELDDIVWKYDIPIFQSQSNAGSQDSRPQAWAKNVISIGAVRHFDTPTLADDCWCGTASIGPAEDGRIKPDLIYWYDSEYTTDRDPGGYNPSLPPQGLYYSAFGGTSGATPICAGVGGLILQMWADNLYHNDPRGTTVFEKRPHSSTTKALLINTAEQYPFSGSTHDLTRVHQGWGLPSARQAFDRAPLTRVVDETSLMRELDTDVYTATVAPGQAELKATMVYTDRAGTTSATLHRVNDLTLKVVSPDGATLYWGNNGLDTGTWSAPGGAPDTLNTVENVFIQNPAPGNWRIEISADEINQDAHEETEAPDQDYALVVYGVGALDNCRARLLAPGDVKAGTAGDNAIKIRWTPMKENTFRVYRSTSGCSGAFAPIATVGPPSTSFIDTPVSGGVSYSYIVRSIEECESYDSNCSTTVAKGPCALGPAFSGIDAAESADDETCGVTLSWSAPAAECGGPVRYNVYRSNQAGFTPDSSNRIAFCLDSLSYRDTSPLIGGQAYYYIARAEDLGSIPLGPCGGVEDSNLTVRVARPVGTAVTLLNNGFEGGFEGWTSIKGSPPATTGNFISGDPVGTFNGVDPAQPEDDHTSDGTRCLYTAANPSGALGTDDVDAGEVMALSPVFNAAGFTASSLDLWRWHYNRDLGADPGDYFALDVSNNGGGSWTNLETLDTHTRANSWTERRFSLENIVPLTSSMKVRVRSADGTLVGNIIESAIDDVTVTGNLACTARAGQPGEVIGAPALKVTREGDKLRLTWGTDCGATSSFGLYRGDLLSGYSSIAPVQDLCDLKSRQIVIDMGSGSSFFLIAPNDGAVEGSLGHDRGGTPRPPAASPCYTRTASLDSCVP